MLDESCLDKELVLAATLLHLSASSLAKLGRKTVVCSLIQEGIQAREKPYWFWRLKQGMYLTAGFECKILQ